jgi:hypothetical protein
MMSVAASHQRHADIEPAHPQKFERDRRYEPGLMSISRLPMRACGHFSNVCEAHPVGLFEVPWMKSDVAHFLDVLMLIP